jgi:ABC-type branched-subunit amino acid transport system ATPase component
MESPEILMDFDSRAALSLSGIDKKFGALTVLSDLTFDVRRGEIHGLIGPNGAGKTTVVNIATGYYKPSAGSVFMDGTDITSTAACDRAAMGLGRSFQGARLFNKLNVETNLRIAIEQRRRCLRLPVSDKEVRRELELLLAEANMEGVAKAIVGTLSYGVRKQIEVVRSCAFAGSVLLLDEPTSGLSSDEIERLLAVVTRHRARLAILIIEHDMEVIMSLCDRITVIDAGRRLMTGRPNEVQRSAEVIAAYLGMD